MREPKSSRTPWALIALPALCLAVALAALLWTRGATEGAAPRSEQEEIEEAADVAGREADEAMEGLDDAAAEALRERAEAAARTEPVASSAAGFLDDLERQVDGRHLSVAVTWTERCDLVEPTRSVLEAYRSVPEVSLVTSGYLDILGNMWGAVVRGGDAWVDVVYVTANEEGNETTVRIVRLLAQDAAETED